ncbi:MAG: polyhydroxyalkanoic acid system family protein [Myxococcales bacterium]|nr:polyhydroxyalkanoic acid system family protein [Myxococcales bacterium]MDH3483265.1 polyhydroxyalkanoic acid system family protein [Myxococcales bacterium]
MADVRVTQPHSLSPDDAKRRMAGFEEMMKKYGVSARWSGDHADLKGTGVKGSIDVRASDVRVELKLGMLAKAAGIDPARLEKSISRRLKEAFAGS